MYAPNALHKSCRVFNEQRLLIAVLPPAITKKIAPATCLLFIAYLTLPALAKPFAGKEYFVFLGY